MSVRQSLLAILDQGPCYGYQLRHEFDRRTGSTWPLNVGQIYNTLERLERDGLVRRGMPDPHGHVYWEITREGSAEVARWLVAPVLRLAATREELTVKLAVAATLPGVDTGAIIRDQRTASRQRLQVLRAEEAADGGDDPGGLTRSILRDALVIAAESELRWLDRVEQRLARHPRHAVAVGLTAERPKRGRPTKVREAATPTAV